MYLWLPHLKNFNYSSSLLFCKRIYILSNQFLSFLQCLSFICCKCFSILYLWFFIFFAFIYSLVLHSPFLLYFLLLLPLLQYLLSIFLLFLLLFTEDIILFSILLCPLKLCLSSIFSLSLSCSPSISVWYVPLPPPLTSLYISL